MDRKEYNRQWSQTPKGRKSSTIRSWKTGGLIGDYDAIYERYINTTHCDDCKIVLATDGQSRTTRCMDHNHKTGEFRNVLCKKCNSSKRENQKNKSGHRGVYYIKGKNLWMYQKRVDNKIKYQKRCKCKITLLTYKFCYLLLNNS
tara:strand:+ start:95 stop:529 length:435 start_codon:yes stop_codon:yes gene_type:complete